MLASVHAALTCGYINVKYIGKESQKKKHDRKTFIPALGVCVAYSKGSPKKGQSQAGSEYQCERGSPKKGQCQAGSEYQCERGSLKFH
jgi:hypothetical protein